MAVILRLFLELHSCISQADLYIITKNRRNIKIGKNISKQNKTRHVNVSGLIHWNEIWLFRKRVDVAHGSKLFGNFILLYSTTDSSHVDSVDSTLELMKITTTLTNPRRVGGCILVPHHIFEDSGKTAERSAAGFSPNLSPIFTQLVLIY